MSDKKIAVVSGGTRGIGLSIAKQLKADGHKVLALYGHNKDAAEECEKKHKIQCYQVDVSQYKSCADFAETVEKEHGVVSILVNNAGITADGMLHKMEPKNWNKVIDTNLSSCFNLCRALILGMRAQKYGRIVNISSINGLKGQLGQTNYSAAKAGMIGFTKALALESANKKITVNAVAPGYIETEMTGSMPSDVLEAIIRQIPAGRMGQPQEIADIVAFLASEKAAFITGTTLSANGGQYL